MPQAPLATPRITVRLFKTISRGTVDGSTPVSSRYAGKDEYIDLTPFLNDASSVRTRKSVREPAGAWSITFADKAQSSWGGEFAEMTGLGGAELESIYGLVEPMDMIEIRMWHGIGAAPAIYPIAMRGFVSDVRRSSGIGQDGRPQRQVMVSGLDYGKIWQTFQVIYLAAYAEGKALLTNFGLWELFGLQAVNTMKAGEFVRMMMEKIINPHLDGMLPKNTSMPREIQTGDSIAVKHGVINNSYQQDQGSIYQILAKNGDVGPWNELYIEDREDGVHCVYRPIPALRLSAAKSADGSSTRKIHDDAPDPIYVDVPDGLITSMSLGRSDSGVANFFWTSNTRYDLIDDMQRKLASIPKDDGKVSIREYPNSAVKYYGVRPMYTETQMSGDEIKNANSGQKAADIAANQTKQEAWIDKRRRQVMETNRDNVVFEIGSLRIKGGIMRSDGKEMMKAGDYARVRTGRIVFEAYIVQIEHEFLPFNGFTTTLTVERGTGFVERIREAGSGGSSPWLAEQATRIGGGA